MPRGAPRTWAVVASLVAVTAVWGSTFVVVKDAITTLPVLDFLTWRFALATVAMLLLRPRAVLRLSSDARRYGVLLGVALGAGYVLQTFGLETAGAGVSGFITGMFVVFTPLTAYVLLRKPPGAASWLAVGIATLGLGLLSLHGFEIGRGELLTLGCALAFALHIVGLGEWSAGRDAYGLAVVQLAVVAVGCLLVTAPTGVVVPRTASVWWALGVTAVLATAVAFVVQTWAQAHLQPTRAAVIMTMEPVFAGLVAVSYGEERFGVRELVGSALILGAMLLVELGPRRGAEGRTARLES